MNELNRYPAKVFWSDEDDGFIAIAPDLPGCSAFGATQSEALEELQSAIAAWIEASRSAGNPIPQPSVVKAEPAASGKVLVRMPKTLHRRLLSAAETEATSMNHFAVYLLTRALSEHELGGKETRTEHFRPAQRTADSVSFYNELREHFASAQIFRTSGYAGGATSTLYEWAEGVEHLKAADDDKYALAS